MAMESNMLVYLHFMEWFKNNHAELHRKYWQQIMIPAKNVKIPVSRHKIDAGEYESLMQVIAQYYNTTHPPAK